MVAREAFLRRSLLLARSNLPVQLSVVPARTRELSRVVAEAAPLVRMMALPLRVRVGVAGSEAAPAMERVALGATVRAEELVKPVGPMKSVALLLTAMGAELVMEPVRVIVPALRVRRKALAPAIVVV